MVRKLILGAVAAVGLVVSAGAASAAPPVAVQPGTGGFYSPSHRDHDYVVFVKHGHHWHRHARYETRWQAEHAVRHLEREGYFARIEVVRDRW
jgi:hypothetical protein